jgi:hypothetical protein
VNDSALNSRSSQIAERELGVLRTICATRADSQSLSEAFAHLADYRWEYPDHEVVFAAATKVFKTEGKISLEKLAAQTTRAGFPDIDWPVYFDDENDGDDSIEDRVSALLRSKR